MAKKVEEIKLDNNKAKKPTEKKVDIALEEVNVEEVKPVEAEVVAEPVVEKVDETPKEVKAVEPKAEKKVEKVEPKKADSDNVKAIQAIMDKCAKNNDQLGYNFWSAELKKALN